MFVLQEESAFVDGFRLESAVGLGLALIGSDCQNWTDVWLRH